MPPKLCEPDLNAVWAALRQRWLDTSPKKGPDPHATPEGAPRTVERVRIRRGTDADPPAGGGWEVYRTEPPALVQVAMQERHLAPWRPGEWVAVLRSTVPYENPRAGKRTNIALTRFVNESLGKAYHEQVVSQWATGSNQSTPPWGAILVVCRDLGLDVLIGNDGSAYLVPARGRS